MIKILMLIGIMWSAAGTVTAADRLTLEEVREHLAKPRHHLLMRHAYAPGTGDPENFDIRDCFTQRNLDSAGRRQAADTGATLRAAGLRFDAVYTSQWCRCQETARLLKMGPSVEELPALNSTWLRGDDRTREQSRRLGEFLAGLPPDATTLLVTHQANILAFTGVGPVSGQSVLIEYTDDGPSVIGVYP